MLTEIEIILVILVALADPQRTTRLVLNADGARVDLGRGEFYIVKLVHLRFRRMFLAVFQIGACTYKTVCVVRRCGQISLRSLNSSLECAMKLKFVPLCSGALEIMLCLHGVLFFPNSKFSVCGRNHGL